MMELIRYLDLINLDLIYNLLIAVAIFAFWVVLRRVFTDLIFKYVLSFTQKTKTNLDNLLIQGFRGPLQLFFIVLGLYLALSYLPFGREADLFIARCFRTAIIILITVGFYNLADRFQELDGELEKLLGIKIDKILWPVLAKTAKVITVALSVTIIAQEWEYRIDGFIAGLGLGGLAISLAAKDALTNFFGGLVIITDKPFSIGDWIATPSVEGTVEDINFRSTKIRTFADALVTIPNAVLANESITNWSRMGKRRITFNLGIMYNTPKEKIARCISGIKEMLEKHPEVHKETIFVRFDSFGESGIEIFLYFFTITTNWAKYLEVKEDINFKIMEILEREGVALAFPSTSVYFENELKANVKH